jgi:arabinose-5-phosphate isomerase
MKDVLKIIDEKKFGVVIITGNNGHVQGVITDGDLRRLLLKGIDFSHTSAADCMTANPLAIGEDNLAVEALKIMEEKLITSLVVTENNILKGLVHLHDLWRTEMI